MEAEIWKDVQGYEGYYMVSNHGRVKSLHRVIRMKNGRKKTVKNRILNPCTRAGYPFVLLYKDKNNQQIHIHRLVLSEFDRLPIGKEHCNHKNGIKTDNHLENLEWVTPSENLIHAYKTGLRPLPKGENHSRSKLTNDEVYSIKVLLNIGERHQSISERYGVCRSLISAISRGTRWPHIELEPSLKMVV